MYVVAGFAIRIAVADFHRAQLCVTTSGSICVLERERERKRKISTSREADYVSFFFGVSLLLRLLVVFHSALLSNEKEIEINNEYRNYFFG